MSNIFLNRYNELRMGWTFLLIVVWFVGALAGIIGGINYIDARQCYERSEAYGLSADYGMFKGCIVKTENGTVTTLSNYLTIREGR